ncbi:amino acid synthesis family protein [Streptomyces sp. WI04-05B]|uniref:amino acid synthesis family protein n=1 Tax=Streptomyces TaxID=1883 RepID=UPI0029ADA7AC|nr:MULTISPECIES: amino acid synthesis family protein [unclassified Streptomyces]MDX2546957.1 amino acid synthesis family protein [Streptomyces sp. WI04-05B]MDX2589341.1 amino acid synthesis family protein [Streptomyces sp. WI04-05A]MDX3748125.1 amino acid synthesis family protein [Streptomyces sp. AK08-02]
MIAGIDVRRTAVTVETIHHEGGPRVDEPLRLASAAAVVRNPFAGRYEPDLLAFQTELRSLGAVLATELVELLDAKNVEAYGKGAVVGVAGELEHGALWHEAGGWAMREVLGEPKAIVPSTKVVAATGYRLLIPLHHIEAAYVRSHFNTIEVGIQDAPRPDEILYALAMATGGRVHARVGGLTAAEITVHDGNR